MDLGTLVQVKAETVFTLSDTSGKRTRGIATIEVGEHGGRWHNAVSFQFYTGDCWGRHGGLNYWDKSPYHKSYDDREKAIRAAADRMRAALLDHLENWPVQDAQRAESRRMLNWLDTICPPVGGQLSLF